MLKLRLLSVIHGLNREGLEQLLENLRRKDAALWSIEEMVWRFSPIANPTTTLLEHTLLTQGFTGVQKAAFTCRLRPQNRDSTWVDLVNTLK